MGKEANYIQKIIDQIIELGGLKHLPESAMKDFRDKMEEQINRRIGLIILDNLSDEALAEYEELVKDSPVPDPKRLQALLEKDVPDYQEKISSGLNEFIKEMVAAASK